jgi:Carboxypeptidase regulatory-like domain
VAAGCTTGGVETLSVPDPPATTVAPPAPPETLPPGLASRTEAPVAGVTTTTAPAVGPGPASVNGTVTGPSGPVAGATVEVDRFVGDTYASARTTTAADGSWVIRNLLGGDYRIRAWQAPTLDMDSPATIFLVANQPQSVNLQVVSYASDAVQIALDPANPVQNQPTNLVVQVTQPSVDANGVFTAPPVVGASVLLVNGPAWQVNNGNPLPTNSSGQVTFEVECTTTGSDPLAAQVGKSAPISLAVPSCSPPPTPPTTSPPPNSTSTTCPPNAPATQPTTTSVSPGSC